MKILFIAPPLPKANTPSQPLGFGYLASVLRKEGYPDIHLLDACSLKLSMEQTITYIKEAAPDVVGLTMMTVTAGNALKLAAAAKSFSPRLRLPLEASMPLSVPMKSSWTRP